MAQKIKTNNNNQFIYVPSINLEVAEEITMLEKPWFSSHKELQLKKQKILTFLEFAEFLKYVRQFNPHVYENVIHSDSSRMEWLDAVFYRFKLGGDLMINSNHQFNGTRLIPKNSQTIAENTLIENRNPGIDLIDWIENPTKQGLPTIDVKPGDLSYLCYPQNEDFQLVGGFSVCGDKRSLSCGLYADPTDQLHGPSNIPGVGVREARSAV